MYTNVQEALSRISGFGLARANRFGVKFALPNWSNISEYEHLVEGIEIPNMALSTADYQLNSLPLIKVPYAKTPAGTCTIIFRESRNGTVGNSFTNWIKYMIDNPSGEYFARYVEDVWGQVVFTAYNTGGAATSPGPFPEYRVTLIAAIPTTVESVSYSFDDRDSYIKQSVTFAYHDVEFESNPPQR